MIPAKINRAAQSATGEAQPAVPGEEGKDEDDAVLQRMEWFYRQRAFPLPHIPAGARLKAFEQMENMMESEGKRFRTPQGGFAATATGPAAVPMWQPIGPAPAREGFFSPVTGRITTIAVDPRDPSGDTVLIGGAQGGIWRSTNAGSLWEPETDFAPSLARLNCLCALEPEHCLCGYRRAGLDRIRCLLRRRNLEIHRWRRPLERDVPNAWSQLQ
jgi:hypothetical protein